MAVLGATRPSDRPALTRMRQAAGTAIALTVDEATCRSFGEGFVPNPPPGRERD